jgi:EXS family
MFKHTAIYIALIGVNLALRISWTYKLSSHLRHLKWFVFAMTLLEIVRRFLWCFVRIENELRKISSRQPGTAPLIPTTPKRKTSTLAFPPEQEMAWGGPAQL